MGCFLLFLRLVTVTHEDNGGKCGLCGDRYDLPVPRPHESGGNFTSGVIGRTYQPGRILDVVIEIVANHKGYFEFSLCERNDPNQRETEECFDKRLLELADGTGTKFHIPRDDNGFYIVPVKIPQDVNCAHCVLRWHWRSENVDNSYAHNTVETINKLGSGSPSLVFPETPSLSLNHPPSDFHLFGFLVETLKGRYRGLSCKAEEPRHTKACG
ncbi:chitin-binding type-4 domain-containing protein [Trichonephila clavipes]|nr:chitin-binding type-4 domain-containing protein [Trichonephila clavipes]